MGGIRQIGIYVLKWFPHYMTKEQAISRLRLNVYGVLFDSAYTSISIS